MNARYGNEPGVSFYIHISDQFGPFYTKVIAATASEAPHEWVPAVEALLTKILSIERDLYTIF